MDSKSKDKLISVGDNISTSESRWTFAGEVAKNFDQHVKKSVPFYEEAHSLAISFSDFFVHSGSNLIDLGCSTGTLLQKLAKHHSGKTLKFTGVDIEPSMIAFAEENNTYPNSVFYMNKDLLEFTEEKFDFAIAFLTLQFISPSVRQLYFDKIYQLLNWGGAVFIYDKVRAPDARFQDIVTSLYFSSKLENGFTPEEVISKMLSLKGVQEPYSSEANVEMLKRAGFMDYMTVCKWLNFEGILAVK